MYQRAEQSTIFSIKDVEDYKRRLVQASAHMKSLAWGAQSDCAQEIGRQPIVVSQVLRGITINEPVLIEVEEWLKLDGNANPLGEPPAEPASGIPPITA